LLAPPLFLAVLSVGSKNSTLDFCVHPISSFVAS